MDVYQAIFRHTFNDEVNMNDEESTPNRNKQRKFTQKLVTRAIQGGYYEPAALAELVSDKKIKAELLKASAHNPLKGKFTTFIDLVRDMERRTATDFSRTNNEKGE